MLLGAACVAGCGSGTPPSGVLTTADMPAALHLKQITTQEEKSLAAVFNKTYPGCVSHYAVLTLHGRPPSPVLSGKTIYPEVFSESATCPSTDKAHSVFQGIAKKVKGFGASTVSGIGDAAILNTSRSATARSYIVFWQDGSVLASVQLSGPAGDTQISVATTKDLARRQIAAAA